MEGFKTFKQLNKRIRHILIKYLFCCSLDLLSLFKIFRRILTGDIYNLQLYCTDPRQSQTETIMPCLLSLVQSDHVTRMLASDWPRRTSIPSCLTLPDETKFTAVRMRRVITRHAINKFHGSMVWSHKNILASGSGI